MKAAIISTIGILAVFIALLLDRTQTTQPTEPKGSVERRQAAVQGWESEIVVRQDPQASVQEQPGEKTKPNETAKNRAEPNEPDPELEPLDTAPPSSEQQHQRAQLEFAVIGSIAEKNGLTEELNEVIEYMQKFPEEFSIQANGPIELTENTPLLQIKDEAIREKYELILAALSQSDSTQE